MRSPFTPTFGVTPPLLVGRESIQQEFAEALDSGVGDSRRALLVTGARGVGKTVLLNAFEDLATERQWRVLQLTTRPGVLQDAQATKLPALLADELGDEQIRRLSGFTASLLGFGGGVSFADSGPQMPNAQPNFESQIIRLADECSRRGAGLLITIDEVHRSATEDLMVITQSVQHAFRQGKEVAIALGGLPSSVDDLLNESVLTFIRRAERYTMGNVSKDDVREAIAIPLERAGKAITPEALEIAVRGTNGYPFLIQTIGNEMWKLSADAPTIDGHHARDAVASSIRRIGEQVHAPEFSSLSRVDRSFLLCMAQDDGPTRTGDIAARLGVVPQYVTQYRNRLIAQGLIRSVRYGYVDFELPYLREHLREHVAAEALQDHQLTAEELRAEVATAVEAQQNAPAAPGTPPEQVRPQR